MCFPLSLSELRQQTSVGLNQVYNNSMSTKFWHISPGYHQAGKESREKAELIMAEKKARAQVEELKRKFEEYRRDYEKRKEHLREESLRKAKALSEDHKHLQRELSAKKQEAQALLSEMECTAQAFDEMQEQNIRLLQQLKVSGGRGYHY